MCGWQELQIHWWQPRQWQIRICQQLSISLTLWIFSMFWVLHKVYQIWPKENLWFTLFLKRKTEAALMVDEDLLTSSRFLELIGIVKVFDRMFMRIVAEIYNGKIAIQA